MSQIKDQKSNTEKQSVLIVIPVYNEEKVLQKSINTLRTFLDGYRDFKWQIIIADNNSNDRTGIIGREIASKTPDVNYLYIPQKGRGIALRTAWSQTDCDFVSYMDVDLSTGLDALIRALKELQKGADVVVGNRLDKDSDVKRSFKREFISRSYNIIIKLVLGTHFSDAQCGFKTGRVEVVQRVLPYIEDNGWFFDTEFLFYVERLGYRIVEIPVTWVEDPDTKARILRDAYNDLKGLYRLRFRNNLGQR